MGLGRTGALAVATVTALMCSQAAWGGQPPDKLLASYTHHASASTGGGTGGAVTVNVVAVRLSGDFPAKEQADIAQAIAEWNHTLNGYLRFELRDAGERTGVTILRVPDKGLPLNGPSAQRLALTMRAQGDGGVMLVFGDRIGVYDLRRIVLHEFGHLLGLEHDERSDLMFPRYFHSRQACIDRTTVEMLAAQRSWQVSRMNWCDTTGAAARAKVDEAGPDQGRDPNKRLPPRTGLERRMTRGVPGLHESAPSAGDDDLSEIACPHGSDRDDDDRAWLERVMSAYPGAWPSLGR